MRCTTVRSAYIYAYNYVSDPSMQGTGDSEVNVYIVMRACGYAPMLISVSEIAPSRICVPNMRPCYIP